MTKNRTYKYICAIIASVFIFSAMAGCSKPIVHGGYDTTEWDEQKTYAAKQRKKQSLEGTELDPAIMSKRSTKAPASRMSPESAFAKDKEHLYVSSVSGPVTVFEGNIYHWVNKDTPVSGHLIAAPGHTEQIAATMSDGILGKGVIQSGSTDDRLEVAGEEVEGEVVEGEMVEGEVVEGEVVEDEMVEDEMVEGEVVEGEMVEDEMVEGEVVEGEVVEDEVVEDEVVEDEVVEDEVAESEDVQIDYGEDASLEVAASGDSIDVAEMEDEPIASEQPDQADDTVQQDEPGNVARFNMDEVVYLVRTFEQSMKSRSPEGFRNVFTRGAKFHYLMIVPGGEIMDETYNLNEYIRTHERGWRNEMNYDFQVSDIAVTVSEDGGRAIAEGKCIETLSAGGRKVTAEYLVTFEIEKTSSGLRAIAMKAEGDMEAFKQGQ